MFNFIRTRFAWLLKILYYNISLKNVPLFNKSPFLWMDIVQTEIRSGNVQLDKMYSLYLIECAQNSQQYLLYKSFTHPLNFVTLTVLLWE